MSAEKKHQGDPFNWHRIPFMDEPYALVSSLFQCQAGICSCRQYGRLDSRCFTSMHILYILHTLRIQHILHILHICIFFMTNTNDVSSDDWDSKRQDIAAEHNLPQAQQDLRNGWKAWIKENCPNKSGRAEKDNRPANGWKSIVRK